MKSAPLAFLLVLTLTISAFSVNYPEHARIKGPVLLTGVEDTSFTENYQAPRSMNFTLDEGTPGSVYYTVGTTYYDNQHNGTAGKQLAVDQGGFVHHVWTKGLEAGSATRHVYYRCWEPSSGEFIQGDETQIDASNRAGFVTVAARPDGFAFPAFHQILVPGGDPHAAVAIDFLPRSGAYLSSQIPLLPNEAMVIWPKIDIDIEGNVHTVSTESEGDGLEYYAKGFPQYDEFGFGEGILWPDGFMQWDSSTFITLDVSTSWHSNRVAVAWIKDPIGLQFADYGDYDGYNVWLKISEDGGVNWGESIPVTNIPPIDTMCVLLGGDPTICNADTMHPWLDCSVLLDDNDVAHVAFSASGNFYWDDSGAVNVNAGLVFSSIWHWGEDREEFNIINEAWFSHSSVSLGTNNLMTHRPNLAIDTITGYLYCSFVEFDSVQISLGGYPSGDSYMSVSTDGGQTWAEKTNISNTVGSNGGIDTPAGECASERDVMLAKFVTDGIIHVQYQLDLDNGTSIMDTPEGVPTNNPIIYQRIPVEDIPTTPIINPFRAFRADSTGYPWVLGIAERNREAVPHDFTLYQNYPNPFNPTTHIQFDLQSQTQPVLTVFDVMGREVARLLNGQTMSAGTHVVEFDATGLSSGVYFYRLETPLHNTTRKMMLIK
ncbi:T9SS type A sorting domain-containing protein [bacterium]|nr:T9SS type A sorting domain-containing protein [bacterium]